MNLNILNESPAAYSSSVNHRCLNFQLHMSTVWFDTAMIAIWWSTVGLQLRKMGILQQFSIRRFTCVVIKNSWGYIWSCPTLKYSEVF